MIVAGWFRHCRTVGARSESSHRHLLSRMPPLAQNALIVSRRAVLTVHA